MRIQLGVLVAALASTVSAQDLELPFADIPLAQNTGAADRGAAGNGSMGIGDGIDYLEDDQGQSESGDSSSKKPAVERYDDTAEPGHGGNETDMEHRRRPKLERRSD
ncbi:MAG: hypothetical protein VR76_09150 [Pseudomonas sp. BRH_c35]|nr:MAG: hypothetical protein VR76_10895 [Pseudomonas sp. BRH_c35]KJS27499.1 MAG: hypothetical protein VR76_09150 [Pseudomonas sp. BRH_c35]